MSHFTEGVLQAYLDEEVVADARTQVTAHVSGCAECAARLQEMRDLNASFADAMQLLGPSVAPSARVAELRSRAERLAWRERWSGSKRYLTRAAVLIFGVALATVPGSPVRAWLVDAWRGLTKAEPAEAPVVQEPAPSVPEPLPPNSFNIVPLAGRVDVILQSPAAGTLVRIVLVDSERAGMEVLGGTTAAGLRTSTGRIIMTGGDQKEVRISLPRTVEATIEVNGRTYVSKEGDELRFVGPGQANRTGGALTFRTPQ